MEWRRLNQSDGLSFNEYAAFLLANPGWPGEERMRKTAEGAINLLSYSPSNVTAYFAKYPPLSNSGWARYAVALASSARPGDMAIAQNAARSEEHTSELQSLMRISYAVFCLKKKNKTTV